MVIHVKQVHNEFVKPMNGSHEPPLAYVGLITCSSLSSKFRKYCPFFVLDVKVFCHSLMMSSHSFFLLIRYKCLLERIKLLSAALTWSLTSLYQSHLALLGQYQKEMVFL